MLPILSSRCFSYAKYIHALIPVVLKTLLYIGKHYTQFISAKRKYYIWNKGAVQGGSKIRDLSLHFMNLQRACFIPTFFNVYFWTYPTFFLLFLHFTTVHSYSLLARFNGRVIILYHIFFNIFHFKIVLDFTL